MNSRCPICGRHFRHGERKRFVTWRLSRRATSCPDCGAVLQWERKSFQRFSAGMWFGCIFSGLSGGIILGPWLRGIAGVDRRVPLWDSVMNTPATAMTITFLVLQAASFVILLSGFFKAHLERT